MRSRVRRAWSKPFSSDAATMKEKVASLEKENFETRNKLVEDADDKTKALNEQVEKLKQEKAEVENDMKEMGDELNTEV